MEGSLWGSTGCWCGPRRPGLPCMLLTLQLQPWGERPTLGGQLDLFKASSGVRDGLLQLLLAASSLCWTSPEDKLRHRDASVCPHLGSGGPSLLHVSSHSRTTAVSTHTHTHTRVWGRDPPKDLFWATWEPYTRGENVGGGSKHCHHHTQLRHSP